MRRTALRSAVWGLAGLVALLLAVGPVPTVVEAATLSVDDDASDCIDGGTPDYVALSAALAAAGSGDTIRVCEGDYTETSMSINAPSPLTIAGPGDTPEEDGTATIHHGGGFTTLFDINADNIAVSGLILDLSPPVSSSGFEISGDNVTVANNEIADGNATAITITGTPRPVGVVVTGNYIHDNGDNVVAYCNSCQITDNTIAAGDTRGIDLVGDDGIITGNTVTEGNAGIRASGTNNLVADNAVTASSGGTAIMVFPGDAVVRDNILSGASGTGIDVLLWSPAFSDIQVEIIRNTLTNFDTGIELRDNDFGDAFVIDALVGGSEANANTFRSTGGTPSDHYFLLDNDSPSAVSAEYNDWGLCTAAEIAREVNDQSDDASLGPVDFVPFIEPPDCPAPRRPAATPTSTPTLEPTTTPEAPAPTATLPPPPAATATPFGGPAPVGIMPPPTGTGTNSSRPLSGSGLWLLVAATGAAGLLLVGAAAVVVLSADRPRGQ